MTHTDEINRRLAEIRADPVLSRRLDALRRGIASRVPIAERLERMRGDRIEELVRSRRRVAVSSSRALMRPACNAWAWRSSSLVLASSRRSRACSSRVWETLMSAPFMHWSTPSASAPDSPLLIPPARPTRSSKETPAASSRSR